MNNGATRSYEPELQASKTILVVEDDESSAEFLAVALSLESQYHPLIVRSSADALEMVKSIRPHLCLIDDLLPDATGIDLYDQLRTMDGFEAVPVIFISAGATKHRQALKQRNLALLDKPVRLHILLQTVKEHLYPPLQASL